jgi:enamidase
VTTLLIENIGEFFTGDLANPQAPVRSILIESGRIAALDPPASTKAERVIEAGGSAVMPGLVDGHIHPVFGEWTPTQDTIGWIGNYVHGGTTTMISACELHVPGLDYENLSPEVVTSLAVVTASTTGRVRWSGAKVHAGTVILVPGMTEQHFDRLAAVNSILAKFIFYPLNAGRDEALQYQRWCRARGIRTKIHTGGVSRSGLSQICGYDVLSWLQPDIAAHVSGGPIPMSDADMDAVVDNTAQGQGASPSPHARHRHAGRHRRDPARHAAQSAVSLFGGRTHGRRGDCGGDRQYRRCARPRGRRAGGGSPCRHRDLRAGRRLDWNQRCGRHRARRPARHRLCVD